MIRMINNGDVSRRLSGNSNGCGLFFRFIVAINSGKKNIKTRMLGHAGTLRDGNSKWWKHQPLWVETVSSEVSCVSNGGDSLKINRWELRWANWDLSTNSWGENSVQKWARSKLAFWSERNDHNHGIVGYMFKQLRIFGSAYKIERLTERFEGSTGKWRTMVKHGVLQYSKFRNGSGFSGDNLWQISFAGNTWTCRALWDWLKEQILGCTR